LESGIAPNTLCYRYAEAYNNFGDSPSLVSSECTWANPPTNLRAILPIGGDYVTLNWDTNSNTSGTKYAVMLSTLEVGPYIDYVSFETNPAQSIEGLTPNRDYWFKVYAINHKGITTESSNVASAETIHETNPPRIYNIRFDGIPLFDNDVIRPNPLITAYITDEAPSTEALEPVSKEATSLNFSAYYIILGADLNSFTFSTAEGVYKLSHRLSVPLGAGTYTFYITAKDALNNVGTSVPTRVRVISGSVQTVGPVLTTPVPFKPATEGGEVTIAYTLSTDAPVDIYMYDVGGRTVLTRKFNSGTNGGRTGYNEVKWNGKSDFGKIVGNGIYVYKIISKGKVIGKGKIVVYD